MNINERIAKAISESGLTQKVIAKRIGVTAGAITQWKTGDVKKLEAKNLLALARVTATNPDWLASGRGDMRSVAASASQVQPWALTMLDVEVSEENLAHVRAFAIALAGDKSAPEWAKVATGLATSDTLPPVLQEVARANGITGFGASSCTALALALAWELEKLRGDNKISDDR